MGELEPVVRAIASLDVEESDYRYYPDALREAATAHADEETKQWLDLAFGLDYSARLLISFALTSAAQRAVAGSEHSNQEIDVACVSESAQSPRQP